MNRHTIKFLSRAAQFVMVLLLFMVTGFAQADGNQSLSKSYSININGDVVTSGVGLRGIGTGDIVISSIPSGATVVNALLYWATIGSQGTYVSPTLNGQTVNGKIIGTSGDTCWDDSNNFVYRADVSSLVIGNGTYTIAGLPNSGVLADDSQGATLVVIYSDTGSTHRTVIINDGAVTLDYDTNTYTDTITGFYPDMPLNNAHVTYIVGDGQFWGDGDVKFNEAVIGNDVFGGNDGDYWDSVSFDVTSLSPEAPVLTSIDDHHEGLGETDCLVWVATVFSTTSKIMEYIYLPLIIR